MPSSDGSPTSYIHGQSIAIENYDNMEIMIDNGVDQGTIQHVYLTTHIDSESSQEINFLTKDHIQTTAISTMKNFDRKSSPSMVHVNHMECQEISDDDQIIVSQTILQNINHDRAATRHTTTDVYETLPIENLSPGNNLHRPYPPVNRSGLIHDHDLPYAEYGHLDTVSIAQMNRFDLAGVENQERRRSNNKRMAARTWAITAWSEVSKIIVMNEIRRQFDDTRLQYVCIASERNAAQNKSHLHVQIITKEVINKKSWFLDEITSTHCNYQITNNDKAWNEYIKKSGDFIEFGEFKSPSSRGAKQWPELPPRPSSSSNLSSGSSTERNDPPLPAMQAPTSRRNFIEERRQRKIVTAQRALLLAETDVSKAMDLVREAMPMEFMAHSSWYLTTFNYVRLQAQRRLCQTTVSDAKQYQWPSSFPDCTPDLREAMNRWIRHHFSRKSRAKCLILIGPTGIGKTSFALSLPGMVNYFKGRWHLDNWNPVARYCVFDDIGWDNFEKLNYPSKKDLLTQNGLTGATDKYRHSTMINIVQPAIVLLNPGKDEGSLTAKPHTKEAEEDMKYWKKRAFIYRMGPDEYFYKRSTRMDRNTSASSNSTTASDDEILMNPTERA